jgi:exonuclease III
VEDIICLQESKLEFISNNVVRSLWGCRHVDWCYSASRGAFGGILILWDKRVMEKIKERVGEFTVACSFRKVENGFSWAFASVYGPNSNCDRKYLWEELTSLISW